MRDTRKLRTTVAVLAGLVILLILAALMMRRPPSVVVVQPDGSVASVDGAPTSSRSGIVNPERTPKPRRVDTSASSRDTPMPTPTPDMAPRTRPGLPSSMLVSGPLPGGPANSETLNAGTGPDGKGADDPTGDDVDASNAVNAAIPERGGALQRRAGVRGGINGGAYNGPASPTPAPNTEPTPTPSAGTNTPVPTPTGPTPTPDPNATATPYPTATPEPTETPEEEDTPIPTETPTPFVTPSPTPTPTPFPGEIFLSPSDVAAVVNSTFTLRLFANSPSVALGGYKAIVNFDPGKLDLGEVREGTDSLLGYPFVLAVDPDAGQIRISSFQGSSLSEPIGQVHLLDIDFTPRAVGNSAIRLNDCELVGTDSANLRLVNVGGTFVTTTAGQ